MPVWALPLCVLGFLMAMMAMRRLLFGMGLMGLHPEPHLVTKFASLVAASDDAAIVRLAKSIEHPVALLVRATIEAKASDSVVVDEEWLRGRAALEMTPATRAGAIGTFGGLFAVAGCFVVGQSGSLMGWIGLGVAMALVVLVARRHYQVARGLDRIHGVCLALCAE